MLTEPLRQEHKSSTNLVVRLAESSSILDKALKLAEAIKELKNDEDRRIFFSIIEHELDIDSTEE